MENMSINRLICAFGQVNLQEVSILTNSQPHDLVLQRRGGGLQNISDLNPKGMPLHFTLLFPHGTYGWDPATQMVKEESRPESSMPTL